IIGGPVSADGYTWDEVTGPIAEWNTVNFTRSGVWMAVRSSTTTYVAAATAPNATFIDAGIDGLTFGDGGDASLGSSTVALAARAFSPNGDGSKDRLRLRWTNHLAFDSMALRAFRLDGTLAGTRAAPGSRTASRSRSERPVVRPGPSRPRRSAARASVLPCDRPRGRARARA